MKVIICCFSFLLLSICPPLLAMEGMGVGSALMKYALDYARDHHYSVIPNCAFAQAFLLRHTNYRDLIS